jgi:hypothetical protein
MRGDEQSIAANARADVEKYEIAAQAIGEQSALVGIEILRREQQSFFGDVVLRIKAHPRADRLDVDRPPRQGLDRHRAQKKRKAPGGPPARTTAGDAQNRRAKPLRGVASKVGGINGDG